MSTVTDLNVGLDVLVPAWQSADAERRSRALAILLDDEDGRGAVVDPEADPEPWMSQQELAHKLRIHPTTVRRWQLPCRRMGRLPRYRMSEVEAHMKTRAFARRLEALKVERAQCSSNE